MEKFQKNLKQFRKNNNLTQKQLGELAGCNISCLERGKSAPTFELIKAIHDIDPEIDLKEFLFGGELDESKSDK